MEFKVAAACCIAWRFSGVPHPNCLAGNGADVCVFDWHSWSVESATLLGKSFRRVEDSREAKNKVRHHGHHCEHHQNIPTTLLLKFSCLLNAAPLADRSVQGGCSRLALP